MKAMLLAVAVLSVGLVSAAEAVSVSEQLGVAETKTYRVTAWQSATQPFAHAFDRPARLRQRAFSGSPKKHFGRSPEHRHVLRNDVCRMSVVDREEQRRP